MNLQAVLSVLDSDKLLEGILSHLQAVPDLIRCSAVNRLWLAASKHMRPTKLQIPGEITDIVQGGVVHFLGWLQRSHAQGTFQNLEDLKVLLIGEDFEDWLD